jgi:hypothetical protein
MNKPSFGYCWAVHDSFIKPSYLEHFSTLSLDPLYRYNKKKNVIIKDNI